MYVWTEQVLHNNFFNNVMTVFAIVWHATVIARLPHLSLHLTFISSNVNMAVMTMRYPLENLDLLNYLVESSDWFQYYNANSTKKLITLIV